MGKFKEMSCPLCGDLLQGLQLTEQQRTWLDITKDAVIDHMKNVEANTPEGEEPSLDDRGWLAIAEPFLFLYGYMVSREDKKH